ncbi:MAG: sortase [Eubacteriales bacterium]|nr:sortase [Eubacteriales bacterium]
MPARSGPAPRPQAGPGPQRPGPQRPYPSSQRPQARPQAGPGRPTPPRSYPGPQGRGPEDKKARKAREKAAQQQAKQNQQGQQAGVPRWVLISLDIIIVALVAVGLFFFLKPKFDEKNAEKLSKEIISNLDAQKAPIEVEVARNFAPVQGERNEDSVGVDFVDNSLDETGADVVSLTYIGKLVIPKIQVITPLSEEQGNDLLVSLRFGSGIHSGVGTPLGQPGLTTIWGHRFLTTGRDFNRLNEIVPGDMFYIDYLPTNTRYYYNVYAQDIIPQIELTDRVYEPFEDDTVVLITCHPLVYNEQTERLLVYAKPDPDKTGPIPEGN